MTPIERLTILLFLSEKFLRGQPHKGVGTTTFANVLKCLSARKELLTFCDGLPGDAHQIWELLREEVFQKQHPRAVEHLMQGNQQSLRIFVLTGPGRTRAAHCASDLTSLERDMIMEVLSQVYAPKGKRKQSTPQK